MQQKNKRQIVKKEYLAAERWAEVLCRYAGEPEEFAGQFWQRLTADEEVLEEFIYYMKYQSFCCQVKVQGYNVVDVMVWQIDHFKARLDRVGPERKCNGDSMLLQAFDTFLKMRQNPQPYLQAMQNETGTDYPGKIGL